MCSGGITTRAPTGLSYRTTVQAARPAVHPAGRGLPVPTSSTHRSVRLSSVLNPHPLRGARLNCLMQTSPNLGQQPHNRPLQSCNDLAHHLRNQPARLQDSVQEQKNP